MSTLTSISSKELERIAALALEGKTLFVMLCYLTDEEFTAEDTVADWQTIEKVGYGYVRFQEVVGTGSFNTGNGRYELPTIDAVFTATSPYEYNVVVLYFSGETYPHSTLTLGSLAVLATGQTQTYSIDLFQRA